jgi:tetratricopeptide (TPR) repeat protein
MTRKWIVAGACMFWITLGAATGAVSLWAAPQEQQQQQKPAYTLAEYNAYQAAHTTQNPQQRVQALDAFIKQYPNSSLLPYVYRDYYITEYALKNYGATIEYGDRMLALGDKVDTQGRLEAAVARAQAYYVGSASDKSLQTSDAETKARDAAAEGLKMVDAWKKPEKADQSQFDQQVKQFKVLFNSVSAMASTSLKDYAAAANSYKAVLALDPNDAVTHFRLGVAYLQMTPPQAIDGFWELARSIAIKSPNGPNEQQVKSYLRNQIARYQQAACDKLMDDEVSEIVTLAAGSNDRPATLKIPSTAELQTAREDTANFLPALQGGGDAGKVMWLATCGLEFPDVGVRVMSDPDVQGDTVVLKVFRGSTPEAIEAATDANMTVNVVGQPEAARLKKDDVVRFTGTLTGYTQSPFMLAWDKAKINPEDLPSETGKPGKAPRKAPAKKAGD